MSPEAFKYVLSREEYTKITTDNIEDAKDMLHTCFGKDTQLRKDLLLDEEEFTPDPDAILKAKKTTGNVQDAVRNLASGTKSKKKKVAKKATKKAAKKVSKKAAKKKTSKKK